ncbi:MAG: extracellular solute-binding protein [Pirellulales bacterium]|nr:extracellular solute-binding protein [Pirellulales bacterium]
MTKIQATMTPDATTAKCRYRFTAGPGAGRTRKPPAPRVVWLALLLLLVGCMDGLGGQPDRREEIVFWHFWGGRDRPIVSQIVEKFNASQDQYRVRAIAMPGSNLDLKFLLSVAGNDPPDLLNHDDPVVADWAHRGVLTPLADLASEEELDRLGTWLFPAASSLGTYDGRLYALCNGLDIRALYCNKTLLDEHGLALPKSIADLDTIAETIAPAGADFAGEQMGYLPHPRRLWSWGIAFGGSFTSADFQFKKNDPRSIITADAPQIVSALTWMAGYSRRYGPSRVAEFRSGEQALTGAVFPLLDQRRYAVVMDGQWRTRDIAAAEAIAVADGQSCDQFSVVPLPASPGGHEDAGWVNGNFFVVPSQARCKRGAWEFMKFWTGFDGSETHAATACAAGGWIPVSQRIVQEPAYQEALTRQPLLREFVRLARSPHQVPVPALPVASLYYQEVIRAAQEVMYRGAEPAAALKKAADNARQRLREEMADGP